MSGNDSLLESKSSFGEIEEMLDTIERNFMRLRKFDKLPYPPEDHHYKRSLNYILSSGLKSSRAIEKEMDILEESLPDWVFVRAYNSRFFDQDNPRFDLMRVATAGLENTPYRYGLFFFDIFIPSDYPSKPPQVFFHSFGHSFASSKLRQDGRVSLPILEDKNWDPDRTILDILIYIQRSVLNYVPNPNPNPKLKYSVLKKQVSDEEERKLALMQTCEAMLSILENPPRGFGDFVLGYFRKWSHRILLCYKEEMQKHESVNDLQLFVRLLKAFEANGSYCAHHYDDKVRSILKDEEDQRDRKDGFISEKPVDLFKLVWH